MKYSNLTKNQFEYQMNKVAKIFNKINDKERLNHIDVLNFINFYNEFCDVISHNFSEKFCERKKYV